jgi:hypothetical protein
MNRIFLRSITVGRIYIHHIFSRLSLYPKYTETAITQLSMKMISWKYCSIKSSLDGIESPLVHIQTYKFHFDAYCWYCCAVSATFRNSYIQQNFKVSNYNCIWTLICVGKSRRPRGERPRGGKAYIGTFLYYILAFYCTYVVERNPMRFIYWQNSPCGI